MSKSKMMYVGHGIAGVLSWPLLAVTIPLHLIHNKIGAAGAKGEAPQDRVETGAQHAEVPFHLQTCRDHGCGLGIDGGRGLCQTCRKKL